MSELEKAFKKYRAASRFDCLWTQEKIEEFSFAAGWRAAIEAALAEEPFPDSTSMEKWRERIAALKGRS